jgi:hypothetical protein
MLRFAKRFCKKFFQYFGFTDLKILNCSGLIFIKDFMNSSGLTQSFNQHIIDNRCQARITYHAPEILLSCILRILNGEFRLSHAESTSKSFFEQIFTSRTVPDFRTLVYYFESNPKTYEYLQEILFENALKDLKEKIITSKLKSVTINLDQTASAVHGKQERAKKGYAAGKKNAKLFQMAVWSFKETKTIFKLELLSGETHCGNNLLNRLKEVVERLKKLEVKLTFICDSGYENIDVFEYLNDHSINFIFAVRQSALAKKRGKNAKKKVVQYNKGNIKSVLKERELKTKNGHSFRQIFIQNHIQWDEHGQLYFKDFATDEFTNIFVTNMNLHKKNIYKKYKEHAVIETIIEELKNDFKLGISHNDSFEVNSSLAQLVAIAYNVKNIFISNTKILQKSNEIVKLRTFQKNFIQIPGILVNHSGKIILKVEKSYFNFTKNLFINFGYKLAS